MWIFISYDYEWNRIIYAYSSNLSQKKFVYVCIFSKEAKFKHKFRLDYETSRAEIL